MSIINIDFGLPGEGPGSDFSGAGPAGLWNVIDRVTTSGIVSGEPVLDINGHATSLMLTTSQTMFDVTPSSQPFSSSDSPLLGDYLVGGANSFTIDVTGLSEGLYSFVIYTVGRQDFLRSSTITPVGDPGAAKTNTGAYAGFLEEGVTHSTFVRSVDNAGVSFEVFSSSDGFINGMQITALPEPGFGILMWVAIAFVACCRKRRRRTRRTT